MDVVRPGAFFVVGFYAQLTTAVRIRRASRLIRERRFLIIAQVPSRRDGRVSGDLKRVA